MSATASDDRCAQRLQRRRGVFFFFLNLSQTSLTSPHPVGPTGEPRQPQRRHRKPNPTLDILSPLAERDRRNLDQAGWRARIRTESPDYCGKGPGRGGRGKREREEGRREQRRPRAPGPPGRGEGRGSRRIFLSSCPFERLPSRVGGRRWLGGVFEALRRRGSDHRVAQTNPPVRGRVSADRSEEAAQPLTTPRLVRKSSTDDSVRPHCMWGLRAFGRATPALPDAAEFPLHGLRKGRLEARPLNLPPNASRTRYRCTVQMGFCLRGVQA